MANKTKYNPDIHKRIVDAIRLGSTYELAAQYGGIHYDTFHEWMKAKPEFSEAIRKAEGEAVVGWLAKIEKAANDGQWQAAAWKAERRYPHAYGRTVIDNRNTEIKVDWSKVPTDTRDAFADGNISLDDVLRQIQ